MILVTNSIGKFTELYRLTRAVAFIHHKTDWVEYRTLLPWPKDR